MRAATALIFGAATVALVGCTINTDQPVTGVYVGVVYFKTSSEEAAPLHRTDINAFGFWSDSNPLTDNRSTGLGWRQSKILVASKECRVVFFINDDLQAAQAVEMVRSEMGEGEGICVQED